MKDKTFSEIMDEIVNTVSRVHMSEATTTTLAVLLAQLQTRHELDTAKESSGKGYISVSDLEKGGFYGFGYDGVFYKVKLPAAVWESMPRVKVNIYDQLKTVENCTVQILRNSVTGDESFGWFIERGKNDDRRISEAYETETE